MGEESNIHIGSFVQREALGRVFLIEGEQGRRMRPNEEGVDES